jgi:hypothetical protein
VLIKRRSNLYEEKLAEYLRQTVQVIDLDSVPGTSARLLAKAGPGKATEALTVADLLPTRPDLMGLPLRQDCTLDKKSAERLASHSLSLRGMLLLLGTRTKEVGGEAAVNYLEHEMLLSPTPSSDAFAHPRVRLRPHEFRQEDAVSPLVQVLQSEDTSIRKLLVRLLAQNSSPKATAALARRALFDLSDGVRAEAILALSRRPLAESRQVLLDGLRYPWPLVADHAAEAIVALRDQEAIPRLLQLAEAPDPAGPCLETNDTWVQAELVSVNHLRNCALCHAPSSTFRRGLSASVPTPGKPLPPVITEYYGGSQGERIRADVTYLRQDFSVKHSVSNHGAWPELQRFDYMVRRRVLTADEKAKLEIGKKAPPTKATYPQRESVLFALHELSGPHVGSETEEYEDGR